MHAPVAMQGSLSCMTPSRGMTDSIYHRRPFLVSKGGVLEVGGASWQKIMRMFLSYKHSTSFIDRIEVKILHQRHLSPVFRITLIYLYHATRIFNITALQPMFKTNPNLCYFSFFLSPSLFPLFFPFFSLYLFRNNSAVRVIFQTLKFFLHGIALSRGNLFHPFVSSLLFFCERRRRE